MSDFVSRLNELRASSASTNKEIADSIGISVRGFQFYLSGTKEPTLSKLIALADFFNVSLEYLTGRSDNPEIINRVTSRD
ncbi:helix-turn-helix domain-containing protein [Parasporobacterium paucivorans]|uniref:Helix-turn-helix n=1 Tax=Parasporobacterium paucivorans DSM 15970 TaxID=1122934 RepID=A0A1M6F2Q7_9FIRM|nr:helix-turn-helix transcriptional regulator [Parasporobacterium paucivorans]SHI91945.1 Helix-turn-helix [Parasporobacterium paucivorans DSM 15970]